MTYQFSTLLVIGDRERWIRKFVTIPDELVQGMDAIEVQDYAERLARRWRDDLCPVYAMRWTAPVPASELNIGL